MIDTLKFAHRLKDSGMDPKVAEATAAAFNEAVAEQLATRADIEVMESRLKSHIDQRLTTHTLWVFGAIAALGVIQHLFK